MSIYLIRLNPGASPPTYKVGKSGSPEKRLRSIHTVQPKAVLVQTWPGDYLEERIALYALRNFDAGEGSDITAIGTEVFETNSSSGCGFMGHSGDSGWVDEDEAVADIIESAVADTIKSGAAPWLD